MKKQILIFILTICSAVSSLSQSNDILARSYFLKAETAYSEGNNKEAKKHLESTKEYLGTTNAKIEALLVKISMLNKNYLEADNHLKIYFEKASESHSDYSYMTSVLADIRGKANIIRKEKEEFENEYKIKKEKQAENLKTHKIVPPIFPGCFGATPEEIQKCLKAKLRRHFLRKFNGELAANLGLSKGVKKIHFVYRFDVDGKIEATEIEDIHPKITEEIIRISKSLPRVEPGTKDGKKTDYKITFPFSFSVE